MKKLEELYEPIVIEDGDDIGCNPSSNTPLTEILQARLDRRAVLRGFISATVAAGVAWVAPSRARSRSPPVAPHPQASASNRSLR
jgi:hypothetical protein